MMSTKHVLITGGSGLIGKPFTNELLAQGYKVSHLSRSAGKDPRISTYKWDIAKGQIDPNCINGVDVIIHLAGAGIADKRWTTERKQEIVDSRTRSIQLIYDLLKNQPQHQVKSVVSAAGISMYGDKGNEWLTEDHPPEHDFLGTCCMEWEAAVQEGEALGLAVTSLRTGVILTTQGGALVPLALPVKFGAGTALGSGRQYVPWLHMDDAVGVYMQAIKGMLPTGAYNMVAPNPVTNKQLTKAIAQQLRRPLWLPNVPAFLLKLLMGEMSIVVLASVRASAQKLEDAGYKFKFDNITDALKDIYERKQNS